MADSNLKGKCWDGEIYGQKSRPRIHWQVRGWAAQEWNLQISVIVLIAYLLNIFYKKYTYQHLKYCCYKPTRLIKWYKQVQSHS